MNLIVRDANQNDSETAEQEARRAGAPRLDLSSGEWRADARAFYESRGFETRARAFTKRLSPR